MWMTGKGCVECGCRDGLRMWKRDREGREVDREGNGRWIGKGREGKGGCQAVFSLTARLCHLCVFLCLR